MNENEQTKLILPVLQSLVGVEIESDDEDVLSDKEIEELKRKADDESKTERLKKSGVGEKYFFKTLNDFDPFTEELASNLSKVKKFINDVNNKKQRTMWLCGKAGTGKTFLSAMVIRECGGHFCKSYEIATELDDCKSFKAKESKSELYKRYSEYDLLVIDEVGKFESKQEVEYLFIILNERYEKNKSTILVTNKSRSELKEYLGVPLFDRFVSTCVSVVFTGESYRIKERESE